MVLYSTLKTRTRPISNMHRQPVQHKQKHVYVEGLDDATRGARKMPTGTSLKPMHAREDRIAHVSY